MKRVKITLLPFHSESEKDDGTEKRSSRGCGTGREGKKIKSMKKSEVLIFYEREDLLPRLRAISY